MSIQRLEILLDRYVLTKGTLAALLLLFTLAAAGCTSTETDEATSVPPTVPSVPESTAVPTSTPQPAPTETPAPDLGAFQDQLITAINQPDFSGAAALMSDEFMTAPWRSEAQMYTPEEAVSLFFDGYRPENAALTFEERTAEENTAMLDGQPAGDMLGPDATIVGLLFSSGWGAAGGDEAVLFIVEEEGGFAWRAFLYNNGRFDAN